MLKPADRGGAGPASDRSIGELAQQAFDDGKAYVHAEANLLRVKAEAKVGKYRRPAVLAGAAGAAALATLIAFAVGLVIVLTWLIGVVVGSLVAVVLLAALAGGLGYAAKRAFQRAGTDD